MAEKTSSTWYVGRASAELVHQEQEQKSGDTNDDSADASPFTSHSRVAVMIVV